MRKLLIIEIIVGVLILIGGIFVFSTKSTAPEPSMSATPQTSEYISLLLQVSLKYPYGWQLDTEYKTVPGLDRYKGESGYFEVSATNSAIAKTGTIVKKFPKPIKLGVTTYKYFLLTADLSHLKSIGDSVIFISP
jgi:hypothetical protein